MTATPTEGGLSPDTPPTLDVPASVWNTPEPSDASTAADVAQPVVETEPAPAQPDPARRGGGLVPWILVGVFAVAAVVLAVLWVGATGETDDAKDETARVQGDLQAADEQIASLEEQVGSLQTRIGSLEDEIATAQGNLETANAQVDQLRSENSELQSQVDQLESDNGALQTQVDDLTAQVETLEAEVDELSVGEGISDPVALELGRAFGEGANPPLNDEEATCVGKVLYSELSIEFFLEVGFSAVEPTNEQIAALFAALVVVESECDVSIERLGSL